jgi:hypothetical protein
MTNRIQNGALGPTGTAASGPCQVMPCFQRAPTGTHGKLSPPSPGLQVTALKQPVLHAVHNRRRAQALWCDARMHQVEHRPRGGVAHSQAIQHNLLTAGCVSRELWWWATRQQQVQSMEVAATSATPS